MKRVFLFLLFVAIGSCKAPEPNTVIVQNDPIVSRISPQVEQVRKLNFTTVVRVGKKSPEEIRAYLEKRVSEEYKPEELDYERRVLVLFGLLPKNFPYKEKVLSLLTDQIAAYYDPFKDMLFLTNKVDPVDIDQVVSHELTHALQDQHFGLEDKMKRPDGDDDRGLALNALVEGDAVAVMLEYSLKKSGLALSIPPDFAQLMKSQMGTARRMDSKYQDVPEFLFESLVFPYIGGIQFVQVLQKAGGWDKVNEAYKVPPLSSEQILHPQKFLSQKDPPIQIPKTALIFKNFAPKVLSTNVMGEFGVQMILKSYLPEKEAVAASEGWGGDRFWFFQNRKADALVWGTIWDTEKDAREFTSAMMKSFGKKGLQIKKVNKKVWLSLGIGLQNFSFNP